MRAAPECLLSIPGGLQDKLLALSAVSADGTLFSQLDSSLQMDPDIREAALRESPFAVLEALPELKLNERQFGWALDADSSDRWLPYLDRLPAGSKEALVWRSPQILLLPEMLDLGFAILTNRKAVESLLAQKGSEAALVLAQVAFVISLTFGVPIVDPELIGHLCHSMVREPVGVSYSFGEFFAQTVCTEGSLVEECFERFPSIWKAAQIASPDLIVATQQKQPQRPHGLQSTVELTAERARAACERWPEGWRLLPPEHQQDPSTALVALTGCPELASEMDSSILTPSFLRDAVKINPFIYRSLAEDRQRELDRTHPDVGAPYRRLEQELGALGIQCLGPSLDRNYPLLRELLDNRLASRESDPRKIAVVLRSRANTRDFKPHWAGLTRYYRVLYFEWSDKDDLEKAMSEWKAQGAAEVTVFEAHAIQFGMLGSSNAIEAQDPDFERQYLLSWDEPFLAKARLRELIANQGLVCVFGCAAGASENRAESITNAIAHVVPQAHLYAARRLIKLSATRWNLGPDGRALSVRFEDLSRESRDLPPHRLTYHKPPSG